MGTPMDAGSAAVLPTEQRITHFFTDRAWIEGRAVDQLNQIGAWAGVARAAAFPDLHPGKYGPVGCAIIADRVYPHLIGSDIGCGMSLFQLDLAPRKFKLDKAMRRIRALGAPLDDAPHDRLQAVGLPADLFAEALGTIAGGNHFCEVQIVASADAGLDAARLCLLVHSGSRGLGASILFGLGDCADGLTADEALDYLRLHDQAVAWAALNRQLIAERAADAMRADAMLIADAPHNLLARTQDGWLHRKGAAVAGPLVPLAGSRATASYLMRCLDQPAALNSMAHGAGRRYDRSSMHGRVRSKRSDLEAMQRTPFGGRVICEDRDLLVEEAPAAYKSAEAVAADLEATGVAERVATLHPLLTFKKTREGAQ